MRSHPLSTMIQRQAVQPVRFLAVLPDGRVSEGGWTFEVLRLRHLGAKPVTKAAAADGSAVFDLRRPLPALVRVQFQLKVSAGGFDARRVRWEGVTFLTLGPAQPGLLLPETVTYVPVQRATNAAEEFALAEAALAILDSTVLGKLVLYDVDEMLTVLRHQLPSATVSLAGKVLDGVLKVKGNGSWWPSSLDEKPLGTVLLDPTVRQHLEADLGLAAWHRLTASFLYLRNTGSHQKYTPVAMPDATASVGMVLDILNEWVK